MKLRRFLSLVMCVLMTASAFVFTASAQDSKPAPYEIGDGFISFDFNDITGGIVNGKPNAKIEKNVEFEGKTAVKFTPTPETFEGSAYTLDCYALGKHESKGVTVNIPEYRYLGITYYYAPKDTPVSTGKLRVNLLPGSTSVIKSARSVESHKPLVAGEWTEAYFDFSDITLNPDNKKPMLVQLHFTPFGATPLEALTSDDVLYVAKYTFYKNNPNPDATVDVQFNKATPEATGDEFVKTYKCGEKFTLPENPFTYDNSEFLGWISSIDNKTYAPGTEFTAEYNCTFTVSWKVERDVEDFISLKYVDYSNEIVNGVDTAFLETTTKDGREVVMCTPNTNRTNTGKTISLDGYKYAGASIDLNSYRWFAIEYYYQAPNPKDIDMRVDVMTSGNILTKSVGANSTEKLVANTWAIALFDMSALDGAVNPDNPTPNMKQMHIRAYGLNTLPMLDETDVMFISRVMFFKEKPDFQTHTAYMNGYADGTFLPGGTMTRAEACTVIARLLEKEENIAGASAFADVPADQWFAKYIGFCEAKGLLKSYSGNFEPNKPITRAEFSELVYLTGLAQDKGIKAAFTDVPESHAKYTSIMAAASAGLINGYAEADGTYTFKPDNTITRAEVVTVINRARGLSKKSDALTNDISVLFFDVDFNHWAFADIAEATVPHVEWNDAWLYPMADPILILEQKVGREKLYDTTAGNAKVAELETLEAKRIAEIKATPNMDLSKHTGRKIYISTKGDDTNDGLTPEKAVKTFTKGNQLARSGDVVLLERGGEWFEKINAKANVTYSAYGEGAKPILNGSYENGADPKKWSLAYENAETGALIWKYYREDYKDIGTIVFNGGEGYAYKDMPDNNKDSGKFTVYKTKTDYDYRKELDRNFEFVQFADSVSSGSYFAPRESVGEFYLRCDNGNPGKVFDSIEFVTYGAMITCGGNNGVTIDNLDIRNSSFGISSGTNKNLTVTNCEFYWIGGNIQTYDMRNGIATRFGNAIEVYGGIDGYLVDNCYFYQIYDAAVTHQVGNGDNTLVMNNITYSNNVMDMCQYSIEYFYGESTSATSTRKGNNVVFENNLMRRAGFGFGSTRRDINSQRHIRSGGSRNEFTDFRIVNNVFDRSVYELSQTTCHFASNAPTYDGNIYIQGIGNQLYSHSTGQTAKADASAAFKIANVLGDKNAQVYFVDFIPLYQWGYTIEKKVPVTDDDRVAKEAPKADVNAEAPKTEAEAGESTEVVAPLLVKTTANKLYAELRTAITMENLTDDATGIKYAHGTIHNEATTVNLDCYSLPKFSLGSEVIYIKGLIRTNCKGTSGAIVYNMVDAEGGKVGNGAGSVSGTAVAANGQWEEIVIKVTGFPSEATHATQIHLMPLGSVKGSAFFNGTAFSTSDGKAPYLDVAAWAIFPNLASANAYDLKADAKA